MKKLNKLNEFVIRFANTNGTGSASANHLFAKSIFRMGIPIAAKNIFPSNIQGMPTWYEVRVSEKSYLGRREGNADIVVAMNAQSIKQDIQNVATGGWLLYDSTRPLDPTIQRDDINYLSIPITDICRKQYSDPRQRQLFKNVIYVGALAAFLNIEFEVLKDLVADQFKGKEKLIVPNIQALEFGYQYASTHYECPIGVTVARRDLVGDKILVDGNTASGLGAVYGGATVAGWYPITPSTSVVESYNNYCKRLRIEPATGEKNYASIQAEDEIAAVGIAIGASWNGARSFTATSGPGVSLMTEFIGLAYFAEVPLVLMNIQRAGPSTGMPTRTQQSDVLACAYGSHGDTKHVMLFPSSPAECFEMSAESFELAEQLQTPIMLMSDLDLGMNDHLSEPLFWDDAKEYDRGKVLSAEDLDRIEKFGRYLDVDGDGICYRTLPGTHPEKGSFFTRGTSRNEFAVYTEKGEEYERNMIRLLRKFATAAEMVPAPEITSQAKPAPVGLIYYGTTDQAITETVDMLHEQGLQVDTMRIKAFPFNNQVNTFIDEHKHVFVIEQNRDAQMKTLIVNELSIAPARLQSILHYDGYPITANTIVDNVNQWLNSQTSSEAGVA